MQVQGLAIRYRVKRDPRFRRRCSKILKGWDDDVELDLGWLVRRTLRTPWLIRGHERLAQANEGEISASWVIQVDLASGAAKLHTSRQVSLSPCQVILPAGYLVQLGYTISWKRKGCVIQREGTRYLLR